VRRRLGLADDSAIGYNKNGAPILRGEFGGKGGKGGNGGTGGTGGELGYIGVSHTRGWVAVVWSPAPCAIDIELRTRTLSPAVAARYSIGSMEEWCALEAEYKFTGLTGRRPDPGSVRLLPHPELIVAVIP
jgi:phosphopantetheinyl transferase